MRSARFSVLTAAVVTAAILILPAGPAAAAGPGRAMVRVAHFSPNASYVDVYMVSLNRRQLFPNVFYKSVSSYWAVAAGPFTYEVRAAGAAPESEPVIQVKGTLAAGGSYTVAAVGRRDQLQGLLLRDDLAPSAPGKAKLRFLDAAFDLPAVDIAVAGGPLLTSRLAYPQPTGYRQLDPGRYRVEVRRARAGDGAGTGSVLVKGTVTVEPGTVTSVALLGGAGERRELYAFGDAAGSRAAPAGGIRTGAGGTAPSSPNVSTPAGARPAEALPLPSRWGSTMAPIVLLVAAGGPGGHVAPRLGLTVPASARARRPTLALLAAWLVLALGGCAGQTGPTTGPGAQPRAGAGPQHLAGGRRRPRRRELRRASSPAGRVRVRGRRPARAGDGPRDRGAGAAGDPGDRGGDPAAPPWAGTGRLHGRPGRLRPGRLVRRRAGPRQVGPAVIAGHVDSRTGPAVFYRLRELRPGQAVLVERADGTRLRFVVSGARSYPKAEFPTGTVFGPVGSPELRLITCAGDFDRARGSYRDNLVVFAHLAAGAGNRG